MNAVARDGGTKRRRVVAGLAVAAPLAVAGAQTRPAPRRIGTLWLSGRAAMDDIRASAFRERLRSLGWEEGRTLLIEVRAAEGRLDRLPELARELLALDVEVIVAVGQAATAAASAVTRTMPIVMVQGGAVLEAGLVASLARPGGNVTGTLALGPEMIAKQLELLQLLVPSARRIALLTNPDNANWPFALPNARDAARGLGLELAIFGVSSPEEYAPTLARIAEARPDALLVVVESLLMSRRHDVIEWAIRARLPALYSMDGLAREGALMTYGPEALHFFVRSAGFVDRILRGAKPSDLPVEQPTTFALQVNLATARAMGFEFPRAILDRADEVIE